MSDADLVADGLMPRNAFATPQEWEESILSAKTRICDSWSLYWSATGAPAQINNAPIVKAKRTDDPPNPHCYCVKPVQSSAAGFVDDGQQLPIQHVAQYGYTWVDDLSQHGPPMSNDTSVSYWVGGSGLFTINGQKEVLQQTGVTSSWIGGLQNVNLWWECVDPQSGAYPCNGAQNWFTPLFGDLITMYTSGNYHWEQDNQSGEVDAQNIGPQPNLDSSEWLTEDPNTGCCGLWPIPMFGNIGFVRMHWLDQTNHWNAAFSNDTDYLSFTMMSNGNSSGYMIAYPGSNPTLIDGNWGVGQSDWWYARN